jgi:predicted CoA-binding protein
MTTKPSKASKAQIDQFLGEKHIAVVGISQSHQKFGNTIFKTLLSAGYHLYPVHKELRSFEGVPCYENIAQLPAGVNAIVICTKPESAAELMRQAAEKGIRHIWLQQGSQSDDAILAAQKEGLNIIHRECILMFAEPVKSIHRFHRGINKVFGIYPN